MSVTLTALEDLKQRANAGDLEALQELRDRGFFADKKAGKPGYPVSHAQRRLWVLDQVDAHSAAYNMPTALRLDGPLNIPAFRRAFDTVIQRHESLRTRFVTVDQEPRQVVHAGHDFHLKEIDLSSDPQNEDRAREYAARESMTLFALDQWPLLRTTLLKLGEHRHILLFNIHHIVCDAWSIGVLIREVMTLYTAYAHGQENPLTPLTLQYKDYAAWQSALLKNRAAETHRRYWHHKLTGDLPVIALPTDYPRPSVMSFEGATLCTHFDPALTANLKDLGRQHGASLFITLAALIKVLLYRYTDQTEIIIGTPIAGRDHPALENLIGFFVNTLALRDSLNGTDPFLDVLRAVKHAAEEAYTHAMYPFDLLVDELPIVRDMSRSPIFDVMVTLNNIDTQDFSLDGVNISGVDAGFNVAKCK